MRLQKERERGSWPARRVSGSASRRASTRSRVAATSGLARLRARRRWLRRTSDLEDARGVLLDGAPADVDHAPAAASRNSRRARRAPRASPRGRRRSRRAARRARARAPGASSSRATASDREPEDLARVEVEQLPAAARCPARAARCRSCSRAARGTSRAASSRCARRPSARGRRRCSVCRFAPSSWRTANSTASMRLK